VKKKGGDRVEKFAIKGGNPSGANRTQIENQTGNGNATGMCVA